MNIIKNKFTNKTYKYYQDGNYIVLLDGDNKYMLELDEVGFGKDKKYYYADMEGILFEGMATMITAPIVLCYDILYAITH